MINLEQYKSPDHEQSFYRDIPIKHLEEVQKQLRSRLKGLRYIFRGPRYNGNYSTRKQDAHSFSVYSTYWY